MHQTDQLTHLQFKDRLQQKHSNQHIQLYCLQITGMEKVQLLTERTHLSAQQHPFQSYTHRRSEQRQQSQAQSAFFAQKNAKNVHAKRPKTTLIGESVIIETHAAMQACVSLDCYQRMNEMLLSQNLNLKHQNSFLVAQIKSMFKTHKQHQTTSLIAQQKIKQLEIINQHLSRQIHLLTTSVVLEISRIQKNLAKDESLLDEQLKLCSRDYHKSLETQGWETEQSVNTGLENLKRNVSELFANIPIDSLTQQPFRGHKLNENAHNSILLLTSDILLQDRAHGAAKVSKYCDESRRLSETYSFQNLISTDLKENVASGINCK